MTGGKDSNFSIYVSDDEPERDMPASLELVDGEPGAKKPKDRMQGGAYNPYQKRDPADPGDTARTRKPRVDLRKLSEWIKTTQQVKAMREEDLLAQAKAAQKRRDEE
jgi:hypothetical protein